MPEAPLDVLAQQIAAEVSAQDWKEDELYSLARQAWPYRRPRATAVHRSRKHARGRRQARAGVAAEA